MFDLTNETLYQMTFFIEMLVVLSAWSEAELKKHGKILVQRAQKDAKVLSNISKLVESGPVNPEKLTRKQKKLIDAIAENFTQNADAGQIVLGKWVNSHEGFIQYARVTRSAHDNPHPNMWNLLEELGEENREEVAWLINQQSIQTGTGRGSSFRYALEGIEDENIEQEMLAIKKILSGSTDLDIMKILVGMEKNAMLGII